MLSKVNDFVLGLVAALVVVTVTLFVTITHRDSKPPKPPPRRKP
jgi:hypothetical protein